MKRHNMPMQRYEFLDGESYGKRYQMVEEANGDWVWHEDVEALENKCAELQGKSADLESKCADLLKALKRLLTGWQNDTDTLQHAVDDAWAAIAKAEGGSHDF